MFERLTHMGEHGVVQGVGLRPLAYRLEDDPLNVSADPGDQRLCPFGRIGRPDDRRQAGL